MPDASPPPAGFSIAHRAARRAAAPAARSPGRRGIAFLIAVLFLAALIPRLYHVRSRFMNFADHNTSNFSVFARNYVDHGWLATRFGQVSDPWKADPAELAFYAHHPPGVALLASISFVLFGVSEPAARLLPLLASAATCPVIFLIGRRILAAWGAILAAIVFAFAPGAAYYGQMLNSEAFVNLFGWLCALAWCRYAESGRPAWWAASLGLLSAAVLNDWPGVYLVAGLSIATALCPATRPRWLRMTVQAALVGVGTAALAGVHILYLMGSLSDISAAFSRRVLSTPDVRFTWAEYLWHEWRSLGYALTPPWRSVAALGAVALPVSLLLRAAFRGRIEGASTAGNPAVPPASLAWMIAVLGLAHHVIFTNAIFLNDNLVYYLLPPAAILAAAGPVLLARGLGLIGGRRIAPLAGAAAALAFVLWGAPGIPVAIRALFTDPVYPGWPIIGLALEDVVPESSKILTPGVISNPQLRFYLWRLIASGKDEPGKLRAFGPAVFFLRDLNEPISPALEEVLSKSPCRTFMSLSLCDMRRGATVPEIPGLEAPGSDYDLVDVLFQDQAALRLVGLSRRTMPRIDDRYLGVPWTPSTGGSRIVHATFVWERLEGAASSLIAGYYLVLRGSEPWKAAPIAWYTRSSAFDLARLAPGQIVRHEIDWMMAEWLDAGSYEVRVLVRASSGLVPADLPGGSGETAPFATMGTVEIASADPG